MGSFNNGYFSFWVKTLEFPRGDLKNLFFVCVVLVKLFTMTAIFKK